ncbi:MAG: hypothetical protein M3094_04540, partial [Actinomycetia bacterium]|nr:hypothetical protein [Actinomycetes bacterium]
MRNRVLLAIGAGAIALSLIGPAVQATVSGSQYPGWSAYGGTGWNMMGDAWDRGMMGDAWDRGMMGGWSDGFGATQSPAPIEGAREVDVIVRDFEISPLDVRVATGEAVNLIVTNEG